jgi:hypothetical protein
VTCYGPTVGVISDSHKISDSIPRICRNDASKLAPSLHARHDTRLTGALKKINWCDGNKSKQTSNVIFETTINCFLASNLLVLAVFPPNSRSNSRYGVTKSLWEYRTTSTLVLTSSCIWRERSSNWILACSNDFFSTWSGGVWARSSWRVMIYRGIYSMKNSWELSYI